MNKIVLNNTGPINSFVPGIYFPRLQVNKCGEIVLSSYKENGFTTGILVGKTSESKSTLQIGQKFTDWEVVGELVDYDKSVMITIENRV